MFLLSNTVNVAKKNITREMLAELILKFMQKHGSDAQWLYNVCRISCLGKLEDEDIRRLITAGQIKKSL